MNPTENSEENQKLEAETSNQEALGHTPIPKETIIGQSNADGLNIVIPQQNSILTDQLNIESPSRAPKRNIWVGIVVSMAIFVGAGFFVYKSVFGTGTSGDDIKTVEQLKEQLAKDSEQQTAQKENPEGEITEQVSKLERELQFFELDKLGFTYKASSMTDACYQARKSGGPFETGTYKVCYARVGFILGSKESASDSYNKLSSALKDEWDIIDDSLNNISCLRTSGFLATSKDKSREATTKGIEYRVFGTSYPTCANVVFKQSIPRGFKGNSETKISYNYKKELDISNHADQLESEGYKTVINIFAEHEYYQESY